MMVRVGMGVVGGGEVLGVTKVGVVVHGLKKGLEWMRSEVAAAWYRVVIWSGHLAEGSLS